MNYARAAGIGAVSGLRSMTGPALVSQAGKTPLAFMALGELIVDKLPIAPDRTDPPSLAVRFASGAFCGFTVCGKGHTRNQKWAAALIGGAAAIAASYIGLQYRRRVKLPPLVAALLEDAVAIGSGSALVRSIGR